METRSGDFLFPGEAGLPFKFFLKQKNLIGRGAQRVGLERFTLGDCVSIFGQLVVLDCPHETNRHKFTLRKFSDVIFARLSHK